MTISRGQMNRQLYMGGGIMNAVPREGALLGGIKKAVKKVTKGVKDIAKSDLGKAALLAAGTYYAGGGNLFGLQRSGMSGFKFANLPGAGFFAKAGPSPLTRSAQEVGLPATRFGKFLSGAKDAITGSGNLGKFATLTAVSGFLTKTMGMTPKQAEEELARDPSPYLERYYRNLNPSATEEEVASFVAANTSEYAEGGRIMRAQGDTASDNAMQAAGIEGLPIRQNPKGVKELDLRENGGFIPPVGIKEKEDDIPAMLSNNEFVFTADAVRGMGDGDVDLGAQRMYDMMKQLEAGGRV